MSGKVDHSHIVPAGYLRLFADEDKRISTVLVDSGKEILPGVRDAGVRGGGHYKRTRPGTGERTDDIETVSIQSIEDDALPILQNLDDLWPLSGDHKVKLAMLFGLQLVRGPRWFEWHDEFTTESVDRYRAMGEFETTATDHGVPESKVYQANLEHLLSSTQRLTTMMFLTAKVTSSMGSMSWSRVAFDRPRLITCDHPVVAWPMTDHARRPEPTRPAAIGILNFLEVRVPLNPWEALLMTWRDAPDDPEPIRASRYHAEILNSFTRAEADKQWFYKPGTRPRFGSGAYSPISAELLDRYTARTALRGELRRRVGEELTAAVGNRSRKAEIHYLPQPTRLGIAAPIR